MQPLLVTDSEKCSLPSVFFFFFDEFSPFFKKNFYKRIFCHKFPFWRQKKLSKKYFLLKISPQITTIASNMKECLRFSNFIFCISPNFPKYDYGWSPLEHHHKHWLYTRLLSDFRMDNLIWIQNASVNWLPM